MNKYEGNPLGVIITGIDGCGKSTATNTVSQEMYPNTDLLMHGPSRFVCSYINGNRNVHYRGFMKTIETLHSIADGLEDPAFVGLVNAMNVFVSARVIEPKLVNRLHPSMLLGARDYYADPAVYSTIYQPVIGGRPMDERIESLKRLLKVPFRDLAFFLTLPPEEAVGRIENNIRECVENPKSGDRGKWRHMHEEVEPLGKLQKQFYTAFKALQNITPLAVYEVNTSGMSKAQVADFITGTIRARLNDEDANKKREPTWSQVGRDTQGNIFTYQTN